MKQIVIEGITPEMEKATAQKFELWDKVLEEEWLESGDSDKIKEYYILLWDPTIYAYAFLKILEIGIRDLNVMLIKM